MNSNDCPICGGYSQQGHICHNCALKESTWPKTATPPVTAKDSLDKHYAELQAECERLKAELLDLKMSGRCACRFKEPETEYFQGFKVEPKCSDVIWTTRCALHNVQLEKEVKAALQSAETKAGAMEERVVKLNGLREADGRLMGTLRLSVAKACDERDAALAHIKAVSDAWNNGGGFALTEACKALPPAPSVASEKEGKADNTGCPECGALLLDHADSCSRKRLPFDLAKALAGAKVVTRRGIVVTGLRVSEWGHNILYGAVDGREVKWWLNGSYSDMKESPFDLFLTPTP